MVEPVHALLVDLVVNGEAYSREVEARRTLADFLREDLELTGTHLGCEHGACGACTIIVDGAPVHSCSMLAVQANGCVIETVEGLAEGDKLNPLQLAFKARHALQCGFCTPGFLMAAQALLAENPDPSEVEVRDYLSGNICRCTGYQFIVDAVLEAARTLRESANQAS
ncbi:MAG TPA: (2Fe-2S)-binding protein [Alphaproteobacteria bacterium]|nr:(2Fe-2S)-binding protein [Alphaproteobacteria bacterium]